MDGRRGMDVEQARLILDADGEAYLCGTSRAARALPPSSGWIEAEDK
ncbi:MAG: hypothetical protein ACLUI3_09640 [Christensenellales bacterium]